MLPFVGGNLGFHVIVPPMNLSAPDDDNFTKIVTDLIDNIPTGDLLTNSVDPSDCRQVDRREPGNDSNPPTEDSVQR